MAVADGFAAGQLRQAAVTRRRTPRRPRRLHRPRLDRGVTVMSVAAIAPALVQLALAHRRPREPMTFYLGTHQPHWLATAGVPLFVSARRLAGRRRLPRAAAPWALDSGGFSEITTHGRYGTSAFVY